MPNRRDPTQGEQEFRDFWAFLKQCWSVSGIVTVVISGLPIAGAIVLDAWVPPFPRGTPFITSGIAALWVLAQFLQYRDSPSHAFSKPTNRHRTTAIVVFFIYLALLIGLTGEADGHRYVKGITLSEKAQKRIVSGGGDDVRSLMLGFGNSDADQDEIWDLRLLTNFGLVSVFVVCFASSAGFFALLVLRNTAIQRETSSKHAPAPQPDNTEHDEAGQGD